MKNIETATHLIGAALLDYESVYFIQIGSNDGVQGDPIAPLIRANPHWSGLFVEPVPYVFQRLVANYADQKRFRHANVAITSRRGKMPFYYVAEEAKNHLEEVPFWYDQIGSFSRDHIIKHRSGLFEPFIVEAEVDCITFHDLLSAYAIAEFDLLHLDTEGHDFEVLSQVDLLRYRPRVVLYEYAHLTHVNHIELDGRLRGAEYRVTDLGQDSLAIHSH